MVCTGTNTLNPKNHFIDELRRFLPTPCKALYICSDPNNRTKNDIYAGALKMSFVDAGFSFEKFIVLDSRREENASDLIKESNLLLFAGGHVPTQNRFFNKIGLKELLKDYKEMIIGVSAGSMNCAEVVYAPPELEGESTDSDYQRFFPGLGLTKIQILPHLQEAAVEVLDGLRCLEDIVFPDSQGKSFYAIPDGSYLFIHDQKEEWRGEVHLIKDRSMTKICSNDEIVQV